MARYIPDSTPMCFEFSAVAHSRGEIPFDEYLDRMLAHLRGTRHPEDIPQKRLLFDALSMVIQSCIFEQGFSILEGVYKFNASSSASRVNVFGLAVESIRSREGPLRC